MKLQFKEQSFQQDAVKAVVNCFAGQTLKSNRFTLERSKNIISKTRQNSENNQTSFFESSLLEEIGYRNSSIQISENQILQNIQSIQNLNDINESKSIERQNNAGLGYNLTI